MPAPIQLLGLVLTGACLSLTACRSKDKPNFEAVLSLPPGDSSVSESTIATELQARADHLGLKIEVESAPSGDRRITVRLRAVDKDQALAHLDALSETGTLSIRAVHARTAYLTDIYSKDPSKFPVDHEILTYDFRSGDRTLSAKLAVGVTEIINANHVESATAEPGDTPLVHISLTAKGGEQMRAATEKMEKGRSRLAIIFDERIISAPVVDAELWSTVTLQGFHSSEEAQAIAASLNKPISSKLLIESLMPLAR